MIQKKLIPLCICLLLCISVSWSQDYKKMIQENTYTVEQIQKAAESHFADKDKGRGSGYKQYKRWEYNATRLMDQNGYLKPNSFYFDELERQNKYLNQRRNAQLNDNWEELGPTNWNQTGGWNPGVGRLTSIAIDNSNTDHIVVGSNVGGVWRTSDEGTTWTSLTDDYNNMDVSALAIDPLDSKVYYWGSTSGRVYKSTDSGATWLAVGNTGTSGFVNKFLIHPTSTNIVYASVRFDGFYKSTDSGATWTKVQSDGEAHDLEFKPGNTDIVYASGSGFYISTDQGDNFSGVFGLGNGAKMMAVTPANPERLYVVEESGGRFGDFYSSIDGGSSFTKLDHGTNNYFGYSSTASDNLGQAPRDMDIVASTTDENEVHIAGILSWRSTNGGTTFNISSQWIPQSAAGEGIGYCHADIDIMEVVGDKLYVGSDGGIFIADDMTNVTANYYRDITSGMGIRAFYKIGISQTDPVVLTGGAQDNGTSTYDATRGWTDWLGADGMETFVDKNNTSLLYGTSQFGSLYKSTNQGLSRSDLPTPDGKSGNWITPFEQDPIDDNTIYTGYDAVYQSTDGGSSWSSISQNFGTNLDHLKIAPSDNDVMYASYGGSLFKSAAFGNWPLLTGYTGSINSIAIHPTDPNKVAIATTDGNAKVYVSLDGGDTWTSFKKNLPDFSTLALVWQDNGEDGLYVGMNYGIYYIDNTLTEWETFSNNLPNVRVYELEINTANNRIYAATYGRGCWSSPLFDGTLSVDDVDNVLNTINTYPNPAKDVINLQWNEDTETSLRLFNNQGQLIYFAKDVSLKSTHQINTENFASGIYFLKMNNQKGSATKKIILQ